jgi:hypothetical protein
LSNDGTTTYNDGEEEETNEMADYQEFKKKMVSL